MKVKLKKFDLDLGGSNNKLFVYIVVAILCIVLIITFTNIFKNSETTYLVEKGTLEFSSLAESYVIKNETIIERDASKTLVPVIAEGKKTAKGGIIATYKNEEYDTKAEKLEEMDAEILSLMKSLPEIYSSEIESVENQIRAELKSALGKTSYVEMQNHINDINELINRRAVVVAELSPSGQEIVKLINERNEYEENMKSSSDNVVSTAQGIVSYTTDGLEKELVANNIMNLSFDNIKELVNKKTTESNIKVIDNFYCCVYSRTDVVDEEYLKIGAEYKLRVVGDSTNVLTGKLVSYYIDKKENTLDVVFEIKNGIEQIALLRSVELEVVWWTNTGLYVPTSAIKETDGLNFVTILKYGESIDVPVNVTRSNGGNSIVENLTDEELEEKNLVTEYHLKLYDTIVIN